MKRFFKAVLALFQVILCSIGLLPADKTVDYGGTPYVPPQIASPMALVRNGSSEYVIVVPDGADACVRTAANELQTYIRRISGAELTCVPEGNYTSGTPAIVLGDAAPNRDLSEPALRADGFRIRSDGTTLRIRGADSRGTLYGVYTFLEEYLGVRWFTPTVETVPESRDVVIDAAIDRTVEPSFAVRRNESAGTSDGYRARTKMNVSFWQEAPDFGGALTYVWWDVTLDRLVPDEWFDTHPEYFALLPDGTRSTDHVCLSNADVLRISVENAREAIRTCPRNAKYFHVGQKDNTNYCRCDTCEALYAKYGSISAPTILFTNALADALDEEFPDFMFTFYAYGETDRPPQDLSLRCRENVAPVLCGLHRACRSHRLTECGAQDGRETFDNLFAEQPCTVAEDFANWVKVADTTYIYDYTINFLNTAQFFSNLETMQSTMEYMYDLGITGYIYNCGDGHEAAFNELRNYLLCKLQWDVHCDVSHHMDEFLRGFYGEAAAPYIREILDIQTAQIRATAHAFDFDWHYQSGFYPPLTVRKLDSLWKKALQAADDPDERFRVEKANLSWEYYKANLFIGKYTVLNPLRHRENEALYDAFRAHGVSRVSSFAVIPEKAEVDFLKRPFTWG